MTAENVTYDMNAQQSLCHGTKTSE